MSLQFVRDSIYTHLRKYGNPPDKLGLKVSMWVPTLREVFSNMPHSPAIPPLVPTMIMGVDVFPVNDNGVYLTQEQALQEWLQINNPGFNPVYSMGTYITVDIGPYRYAVALAGQPFSMQVNASGTGTIPPAPTPDVVDHYARQVEILTDRIKEMKNSEPACHCRSASEHEVGCEYIKWKRSRV